MSNNTLSKEFLESKFNPDGRYVAQSELRQTAINRVGNLQFPTLRDEAWRNTNIRPIIEKSYHLIDSPSNTSISNTELQRLLVADFESDMLVFVNGVFSVSLSRISTDAKITIKSIADAKKQSKDVFDTNFNTVVADSQNIFNEINTVFSLDGSFVYLEPNATSEKPLRIINIANSDTRNLFLNYRNLIVLGENSRATIIEEYYAKSSETILTNVTTEIILKDNAMVDYHIYQYESTENYQINRLSVNQDRGSVFNCHTITLQGGIVRNELTVNHKGEYCETNINGLYFADKKQHFDNFTIINHNQPNCTSNEVYRGIVNDEASTVFFGKIFVDKGAQKTDANQSNKNILLSRQAKINSKPQLEIYADDVKCSHGATTGQLDEDAVFYMQTRGLSRNQARAMMLSGFAASVIENIKIEAFRLSVMEEISVKLSQTY